MNGESRKLCMLPPTCDATRLTPPGC